MSNPSDLKPFIHSDGFIPESEPGKGDGQGWRLNKDGTLEISRACIVDATISRLTLETKARADADEALDKKINTMGLVREFFSAPHPAIAGLGLGISTRAETATLVANATQSLEQLVRHHDRMIKEVEKIDRGSLDLLIMASQQFRTGEALLRELLRKVDTREVDDGK